MGKINESNRNNLEKFNINFIERIENSSNILKYSNAELVMYISEIINTKYENQILLDICNSKILNIIKDIENKNIVLKGMFSDYGIFTFAINNIYKKTGELKNLSNKLNKYLLDYGNTIAISYKKRKVSMYDYDCISGVSGILYHLLNSDISILDNGKIENMVEYLIWLSNEKLYKNEHILNFHISRDMLFLEDEKEYFKEGYVNFGLAHGMSGVLIALTEYYKNMNANIKVLKAIKKIYYIYKKFENNNNNILHYPTQLKLEDYLNGQIVDFYKYNTSWCYGNISNIIALMRVANALNLYDEYEYYKEKFIDILYEPSDEYNYNYPVLCHGFASILAEQIYLYKKNNDDVFLSNLDRNVNDMINCYMSKNDEYKKMDIFEVKESIQGYKDDLSFLTGVGGIFLVSIDVLGYDVNYKKLLMF